jgi:dTDP-glucose 4,6-dehydratase
MEKELSWTPQVKLDDGIRATIDWYKTNSSWVAGVRGGDYRSYYKKYYENRELTLGSISPSS